MRAILKGLGERLVSHRHGARALLGMGHRVSDSPPPLLAQEEPYGKEEGAFAEGVR